MVTEVSGRGVGLDVVAKNITKLNGMVDIETEEGRGTKFSITLPITLVIIKALIVKVGSETFAIPLNSVSESLMIESKDILTIERKEVIRLRDHTLSLLRLRDVFQLQGDVLGGSRPYVIVVGLAEKRLGLMVDTIEGQQEIVIKSLGEILRSTPGIAGATELGNRKIILVLDVGALIEQAIQTHTLEEKSKKSVQLASYINH
jgi:two-component system chemotaxis sensor kinase CheA